MPARTVTVEQVPTPIMAGLERLRAEVGVPAGFPPDVIAAAEAAARRPRLPELDLTEIEFVTIDPPGAKDLDQAVHIERCGDGYLVSYAVADVAAFVTAGDPVDREAHERGQTLYAPTMRTPLHPPAVSEEAASLLPGEVRPAFVWQLHVAADGQHTETSVRRALVRSREQLTYDGVQAVLNAGTASESLRLLRVVGELREQREIARGGVSLPLPEQEIHAEGSQWALSFRTALPVEGWNAQISLLTGIAAAKLMLDAGIGILRTLPPAEQRAITKLRRTATALHIPWPPQIGYPDFVRSLDSDIPAHAAMLNACTLLFRGAGYLPFSGESPRDAVHAALATPYAHTTAPLRRLVDRYVLEICVCAAAGDPIPDWVVAELPTLPEVMKESDSRAKKYERGIVNLMEALILQPRVGERFQGTVIDVAEDRDMGTIQLEEPAVEARVRGPGLELGSEIRARLTIADLLEGQVEFQA